MDKQTIELIIKIGPYIAPIFLAQAIKISFRIGRRWVPVIPFICAWVLIVIRYLSLGQVFGWIVFWGMIYEGAVIGAISIALFDLLKITVLNK